MDSLRADVDNKRELDDSGCVQDEAPPCKKLHIDIETEPDAETSQFELLDFSDDVLLCILKYCSPMDLKALGFTCSRLGRLILDHTLWQRVDMSSHVTGLSRMSWFLAHGLQEDTVEIRVKGYTAVNDNCKGLAYGKRPNPKCDVEKKTEDPPVCYHYGAQTLARPPLQFHVNAVPHVLVTATADDDSTTPIGDCPGPQFTVTNCVLAQLSAQCPNLHTLALECCNFGSDVTGISTFPPTLKKLSMRKSTYQYQFRTRPRQSSLFQINYFLPNLEYLDLSECDWLDAASWLPLSKLPQLSHLYMRRCMQLNEFTAYASLATRYGFLKLKVLDLRESPVGDSEASALGWLPELEELYLSPPKEAQRGDKHSHYEDDPTHPFKEMSDWEENIPDYFKTKDRIVEVNTSCMHRCDYSKCPSRSKTKDTKTPKFDPDARKHKEADTQTSSGDDDDDDDGKPKRNGALINDDLSSEVVRCFSKRAREMSGGDCPILIAGPSKRLRPDPAVEELKKDGCWSKNIGGISIHKLPSSGPSTSNNTNNSDAGGTVSNDDTNKVKIKIVDTSKSDSDSDESNSPRKITSANPNNYVRFRRNQPPVVVNEDSAANVNEDFNNFVNQNRPAGPRHRILYVDFDLPNQMDVAVHARRLHQNVFYTMPLDYNTLVSDSAIRRFGNSDSGGNFLIQISPPLSNARPNRSRLRILSATGYRNVTNNSLDHLATSAPNLVSIDFTGTRVTEDGVERFRGLRPDVEILFGNSDRENTEETD